MTSAATHPPIDPTPLTPRLGYRPALDGLRGVSILAVLAFHSTVLASSLPGGFLGVDIFFVLSGFLITSLLMEEGASTGRIDFRAFYIRRALRLLPALLVLLGCLWVAVALFGRHLHMDLRSLTTTTLAVLFYVSNWLLAFGIPWPLQFNHMWSLALEEQFYLVWPLVFGLMLRRNARPRTVAGVLIAAVAAVVVWRAWLFYRWGSVQRVYFATDTRADAILIGCLFAVWRAHGWQRRGAAGAMVAAAGFILAFFVARHDAGYMFYGGSTLAAVAAGVLTLELVARPWGVLTLPAMRWVGRLSYGIYLWHPPVFYLVEKSPLQRHMALGLPLEWGLAFGCAAGSFYLFERPMLRLKRRFFTPAAAATERL